MINNVHKKAGVLFGVILALLASGIAQATDELITTARRGEENVMKVPLSISTLSADEMQAAQIVNLSDVAAMTPGFSYQNYFGQDLSVPTIRGVSQVDIFGDPNAPVYVDGIYVSSNSGINFGFLDIERIEVLRGPQPAYFGYNAFSGAINFVTAKPSDEFELKGEVTVGTDEKQRISASISGPLIGDIFSGRISALYDDFAGTYDNQNPNDNQDIGGAKYKILSGSLFFTPNDSFTAQWNLYLADDRIDPPAMNQVPANCEPELDPPTDPLSANPNRLLNYCGDIPSVGENDLATTTGETGETREVIRTSLNMDWDVGFGTFSSLTGYSETKGEILASTDRGATGTVFAYQTNVPGPFPGSFNLGTFSAPAIQGSAGEGKLEDFSQEIRFSSPDDRRFRYTLGGYIRTTESTSPIIEGFGAWAGADTLPADMDMMFGVIPNLCPCIEFFPGVGVSAGFGGFIFSDLFTATEPELDYINKSETDLLSGFFGFEYDFRDNLTAYIEGRYTDYEETFNDGNPLTLPADAVEKYDDNFFNWRASLEYHSDDQTTYYGSIATGIKQGGLVSFTPETVNPDPDCPGPACVDDVTQNVEYGQEKIITYELGYKSAFNEGRLNLTGAVFWSDWSDIVLPQIISSVDGKDIVPTGISGNIGDGTIVGFELSLRNQFTDSFSGGLGLSHNKGDFDKGQIESFMNFPSFAPNGDMRGQSLSRQPETQVNANATYRRNLRGSWDWYTRGDVNYQSRWYVGLPNQARMPGRFRANARLGVESDRYIIELWVNNAFDDDTVESAFRDVYLTNALPDGTQNFDTLFPWRLTVSHPQGRTIGLTLRGKF
ncbi:MAG: TonB-dependent receptor plug domain-containing protein [Gammaproteobacteria bacterium]|jgi:iron complex outermembrane receptor protein|nr:TonB-dependent receptor plug domain-containing protein [Gammaproteobacteria bacterium]MDP6673853.1 TonB-dependent receptor plug domain-containing protein [Gammaproteobacteria bacterium]